MLAGLAQLVRRKWIATNVTQDGLYAAPSTLIWSYLVSGGHGSCNYTVAACPYVIRSAECNFFDDRSRHVNVKVAF